MVSTQEWLDRNYPKNRTCQIKDESMYVDNFGKTREEIKRLDIYEKDLEGELNLSDFVNLEKLALPHNKLTSLNLSSCSRLVELYCNDNLLTSIILPHNSTSLKLINLRNNNFLEQDLSFLSSFINLEKLCLENNDRAKIDQGIYNKFSGSLDFLSNMQQLKILNISNTDISETNLDKLPKSLEEIEYSTKKRPDCKLTKIVSLLEGCRWGFCQKCQQINSSENWCQPCAEKEWQQLEKRELVEKFIEQQKLREEGSNLQWIPYEEFSGIKKIAEGGFSKMYRARWDSNNKTVLLKILVNSQNVTPEFLTEITNNKLVDKSGNITECYGISQEPETKNYVIAMQYMEGGNLRQYLQQKKLTFRDKLDRLRDIISGLKDIHQQNLIHRDLHSGNILNSNDRSYVADLGLSQSVNSQKGEGQVFGVLPYVAPEVLQGQPYTQASDIYSFGIVAYELLANTYPYSDLNLEDTNLALKICQGLRPDVDELKIPPLMKDLIKRCWDIDPGKRINANELKGIIENWDYEIKEKKNTEFYHQYQEIEVEYDNFSQNTLYQIRSTGSLDSSPINTKEIVLLSQKPEKRALEPELKKLEKEIDQPLTEEQKVLISDFIQARKMVIKDRNNEEAEDRAWEIADRLEEKGFSEEKINVIIRYCERFIEAEQELQVNVEIPTNK